MTTMKVGVIGAGRIGKLHAETMAFRIPGVEVVAIADVNTAEASALAKRCNGAAVHADHGAIINDRSIDAVLICSPTNTHARYIEEAAVAGKHIFCEKPVDLTLEKIHSAVGKAEKAGVTLMVGFNRRFDPNFQRIREQVSSGKVGEPHILRITSRDPAPPPPSYVKVSGGIFLDMAIHDFDMARYIMGCEVTEVFASGAVLVDPEIGKAGDVDTALTLLTFENGAVGAIDNSRKAVYGYDQRVEVFGSRGMAMTANNKPDNTAFFDATGEHASLPLNFFMDRYTESYTRELQAFVTAVQTKTAPPVTGRDGLLSVAIGLAAKRSLQEHRAVKVDEILKG
jgi:myo-inositol 2-dehydrogenase / D-chiro-inositol 1-dehydrogenase